MIIKPTRGNLLVKIIEENEVKTQSGLILKLDSTCHEIPIKARVIAVGSGAIDEDGNTIPMTVKVDDVVAFYEYDGTDIENNGEKYRIIQEKYIIGILN